MVEIKLLWCDQSIPSMFNLIFKTESLVHSSCSQEPPKALLSLTTPELTTPTIQRLKENFPIQCGFSLCHTSA